MASDGCRRSSRTGRVCRRACARRRRNRFNRAGWGRGLPHGHKAQHDVYAPAFGIVFRGLFAKNINRLANGGIAKFDVRDDDTVEFSVHLRGPAQVPLRSNSRGRLCRAVPAHRLFPSLFHLPELTGARLVIRLLAVPVLGVVNPFLPLARRRVVRINRQNLIVAFHGQVVPTRLIKTIRFRQQLFYLLNFLDELRAHGFVEKARLPQPRVKLLRLTTVRIVTLAQNFAQNRLGVGVASFGDARLGQNDAAFTEAFDRLIMRFPGDEGIGQIRHSLPEFLMGQRVVFCFHGGFATRQSSFTLRYRSLTPRHLALGDVFRRLCKAGRADKEKAAGATDNSKSPGQKGERRTY